MAEFTLKKRTTGQMESDRINDVDDNWGTIEAAIRGLQANASLRWTGDASQTLQDIIINGYASLPDKCMRLVTIARSPDGWGAVIYKSNLLYGAALVFNYNASFGIELHQVRNGTWSIIKY